MVENPPEGKFERLHSERRRGKGQRGLTKGGRPCLAYLAVVQMQIALLSELERRVGDRRQVEKLDDRRSWREEVSAEERFLPLQARTIHSKYLQSGQI